MATPLDVHIMESPREGKSGKIFLSGVFPYSVTPVFAMSF